MRGAYEAQHRPVPGDTRTEVGVTHTLVQVCGWAVQYKGPDGSLDVATIDKWRSGGDNTSWVAGAPAEKRAKPAGSLTLQGREVPLAEVSGLTINLSSDSIMQLSGSDARWALRALLDGRDPFPNTVEPTQPVVDRGDAALLGDALVCMNPGHPEHWIVVDDSNYCLGILVDGRQVTTCERQQFRAITQDWHHTRPSLDWLAAQGLDEDLLNRIRQVRAEVAE